MTTPSQNSRDVGVTATLWLAFCSNMTRTVSECVQKTQEILNTTNTAEREQVAERISRQVLTAYLNRGNDEDFIEGLFAVDDKNMAFGCVETALSIHMRGASPALDAKPYLDVYATRYGESREYLALKLQWITLYPNYPDHVDEAERIMILLTNATPDVSEVA